MMNGKEFCEGMEQIGWWRIAGGKGGHQLMPNDVIEIAVPVHAGRDLKVGTLRALLHEAGIPHLDKKLAGMTKADLVNAGRSRLSLSRRFLMIMITVSYPAVLHPDEAGGYWAEVPDLPGCISQGDTREECEAMITEAMEAWLVGRMILNLPYDPPSDISEIDGNGGRVVLITGRLTDKDLSLVRKEREKVAAAAPQAAREAI